MIDRDRELLVATAKLNKEMGTMAARLLADLETQDTVSADKLDELCGIVTDLATLLEKRVVELRGGAPIVIDGDLG